MKSSGFLRRVLLWLGFFALVALVAGGAARLSLKWVHPPHTGGMTPHEAHEWLHDQLDLTDEQDRLLEPVERQYMEDRRRLEGDLRQANMELAEAILTEREPGDEVMRAIDRVNRITGELQRLAVEHIFEMADELTPEQRERLLELTANALYRLEESDESP